MPIHVDPRKHELLEARMLGTPNSSRQIDSSDERSEIHSPGIMHINSDGYSSTPEQQPVSASPNSSLGGSEHNTSGGGHSKVAPSAQNATPASTHNNNSNRDQGQHVLHLSEPTSQHNLTSGHTSLCHNSHSVSYTDHPLPTTPKRSNHGSASFTDLHIPPRPLANDGLVSPTGFNCQNNDAFVNTTGQFSHTQNMVTSPQALYSSRSNSAISPLKLVVTTTEKVSTTPAPITMVTTPMDYGSPSTHVNASLLTPTDIPAPRTTGKKRRKTANFEDTPTQKSRKSNFQDRGSKRIDELFKSQPGPLYTSCDSSSPVRSQRAQSPSPNTEPSLDQSVPQNQCFISSLNEPMSVNCNSIDNVITTSGIHAHLVTGVTFTNSQLSPSRTPCLANLSDSSGEVPASSSSLTITSLNTLPTTGANLPTSLVNSIPPLPVAHIPGPPTNNRIPATSLSSAIHSATGQSHAYPTSALVNSVSNPTPSMTHPSYSTPTTFSSTTVSTASTAALRIMHSAVQTDETRIAQTISSDGLMTDDGSISAATSMNVSPVKGPNLFPMCPPAVVNTTTAMTATIESQKRQVSELERDLSVQRETVTKLQDNTLRSREVIRELLIEKSLLERKTTRQKVMENRLRLGQFITQRQGSQFEEKWIEGSRFKELDQRRKTIELDREDIERKKKQWNKRKPAIGDGRKSSKSKGDEVSVDEFYEQLEIFDLRKQMLAKEDKEIQMELERLDRERNLHIREIKRIVNEDASRFKDHPLLHERYLLLNLLGKGGFSEVHKGFDLVANRYVACKVHQLNPAWPKDKKDNYIKHALREINIHKTLNHPRIVKVFDVFDIDHDAFCTVLEYSEGNDLDFFLKQNKSIPERDAKSIICQTVSALKYLNERKPPVIHYDLKPGNILLGSSQLAGEIKITDFGLSKLMTEDEYNPDIGMDLTSQGAGTYWYLPPECFETGREPPKISSKVDIWSVGVIFFQCLFGRKPFGHNMSQADILHENTILHARSIVFPSTTKVSDGAKDFIRKCCTYRKDLRPDIFQLCNDDYLKPKAQLKHSLDTSSLPGPVGVPPNSYSPASMIPQASHLLQASPHPQPVGLYLSNHQLMSQQQQSSPLCPSLQPLTLPPSN